MSRKVPDGWREARLGEIASITMGQSPRSADTNDAGNGLPFLQGNAEFGFKHPTPVRWIEQPLKTAKAGDILFSVRAPVGEMNVAETDTCIGRGLSAVRATAANQSFLFSALYHYRNVLRQHAQGSTFEAINGKNLRDLELLLPPLPEQRRIAEILSSVDEAIAATQAVIEQTRTVKQGVLKRLLTRGIGHNRFKQTEIGEIPEAWEVHVLPDLLRESVRNGYSPVCPSDPTGKWILGLSALTHDGFNPLGVKPAPVDDPRLDMATLEPGDIIISRSNTPERVGLVGLYKGKPTPCHYPDLMMRLRFDHQRIESEFAAVWLSFLQTEGYFAEAAAGTSSSMVKINRATLAEVAVPVPPLAEQRGIINRLAQVSAVEDHARDQCSVLKHIKSALISDLLTGRKRAPPEAAFLSGPQAEGIEENVRTADREACPSWDFGEQRNHSGEVRSARMYARLGGTDVRTRPRHRLHARLRPRR